MKTIEMQREAKIKHSIDVVVNKERHVMRHQSLKIQVEEDKPFEVRVKRITDGSRVYTFEPKDDMVLQIAINWRPILWCAILLFTVMILAIVAKFLFESMLISIIQAVSIILCPLIFYLIRWKKFFSISVVSEDNADMSDKCFMSAKSTLSPENNQ